MVGNYDMCPAIMDTNKNQYKHCYIGAPTRVRGNFMIYEYDFIHLALMSAITLPLVGSSLDI